MVQKRLEDSTVAVKAAAAGGAADGPGVAADLGTAVRATSPRPINWDTAVGVWPTRPGDWGTMTRDQRKKVE